MQPVRMSRRGKGANGSRKTGNRELAVGKGETGGGRWDRWNKGPDGASPGTARCRRVPLHWEAMSGNLFENQPASHDSAGGWFTAHCDGGSRGNPGPAGYGAVIEDPEGRVTAKLSEYSPPNQYLCRDKGAVGGAGMGASERGEAAARGFGFGVDGAANEGPYKAEVARGYGPLWEEAQRLALKLEPK